MALSATVHHLVITLSDVDRNVYETLDLRVARHPSETMRYLLTRTLARTDGMLYATLEGTTLEGTIPPCGPGFFRGIEKPPSRLPVFLFSSSYEYDQLAAQLANRTRVGMSDALADKLKVKSQDAIRGQLLAMTDGNNGALGVYMLAVYVIDDTDFWSDGEIYWWSIPTLVTKSGGVTWNASHGLPNGAPPHSCGDLEWMTNIALKDPPLLAVIPPDDDIRECVIRIAVYDDDGAIADFPKAMSSGYEALSLCKPTGLTGANNIISPVRDAIFSALRGEQDDILVEQDLTLRRDDAKFGAGQIGSLGTTKGRVYYFVKDELRTKTLGPFSLTKGQSITLKLDEAAKSGANFAILARGADKKATLSCGVFGELSTQRPFLGDVLDSSKAQALSAGITLAATGDMSVVAYYTPRRGAP